MDRESSSLVIGDVSSGVEGWAVRGDLLLTSVSNMLVRFLGSGRK